MDASGIRADLDRAADAGRFSGVVLVAHGGEQLVAAYGAADRRAGTPNEVTTQFGIASGTKTVTALVVLSLVQEGLLALGTAARDLLGADLPLIHDDVTVEHLLRHRSGIGDYLDESLYADIADFELPVPAQRLSSTSAYLQVLDGHPMVDDPGTRFAYNNGGYVVLALLAERAGGASFYDLVADRVCRPAGLTSTAFLRSDALPARAAIGYLHDEGLRTNVFHLPVRGSGDGGLYTCVSDVGLLWAALLAGRILQPELVEEMVRPGLGPQDGALDHGMGMWLHRGAPVLEMHGYDAGASFRSLHHREHGTTCTVVSNTGDGAGAMREVQDRLVLL